MIKKLLIASATASLIATGTLVASTVGASAGSGYGTQVSGVIQVGYRGQQRRGCRTVVKRVQRLDHHGRPYWKNIRISKCNPHQRRQRHQVQHGGHGHGGNSYGGNSYGYGAHGYRGGYGYRGGFGFNFGW
jgi:hypothetical protein